MSSSAPSPSSASVHVRLEPSSKSSRQLVHFSHKHKSADKEPVDDFSCGLLGWHPDGLQRFANKQTFLALYCLTSVLQGVYYTYFVSVLTTIEKLYQIPSKTTGLIMSSTEIGQISGALLLTYYGGQGHRPRWIASGMIVFAAAALLCSTPHYFFGSQPSLTPSMGAMSVSLTSPPPSLCQLNTTAWPGNSSSNEAMCGKESAVVVRRDQVTNSVLAIFFMSLLLIGLGTTAVNTLGIPYLDDNVAPKESPLYFAITIGVRIFGPVCGFLLGSLCTSIPVDFLFGTTDLTPSDPSWIGAWWLGLFLVGVSLALTSIPMAIFPKRLPQPDPSSYCHQQQQAEEAEKRRLVEAMRSDKEDNCENAIELQSTTKTTPTNGASNGQSKLISLPCKKKQNIALHGFWTALSRLLSNKILLCRTASGVLHILPISGLYTFLPKYLESQFQLTAGNANIISGLAGILVMGFGVFTSGTIMRKFNPSARFVAAWIAVSALIYVLGMTSLMFVGCANTPFVGLEQDELVTRLDEPHFLGPLECSSDCQCARGRFEPVCVAGYTYNSPCIAGCKSLVNSTSDKRYLDCSCSQSLPALVAKSASLSLASTIGKPGLCSLECNTLTYYIIIFSLTVLVHSTSEVGSMLLTLRCVEPQDKAMALGFLSFATGLFGNVPCPILYGAIVDSTCLFWEEDCGQRGACRLYDSTRFRFLFHGLTALIMFLAFLIDLVVYYKAKEIQFHEQHGKTVEAIEARKGEDGEDPTALFGLKENDESEKSDENKKLDP